VAHAADLLPRPRARCTSRSHLRGLRLQACGSRARTVATIVLASRCARPSACEGKTMEIITTLVCHGDSKGAAPSCPRAAHIRHVRRGCAVSLQLPPRFAFGCRTDLNAGRDVPFGAWARQKIRGALHVERGRLRQECPGSVAGAGGAGSGCASAWARQEIRGAIPNCVTPSSASSHSRW
jgi:hypothetical protein